jgi:serine/threonine protein kinase
MVNRPAHGEYGWSPGPGYRVLGLLRRGHDFETYDAWSEERHARCVVKTIVPGRRNPDNRVRLRREGGLLTALDHPHLVRGYEVRSRPLTMLAMETLTGVTLSYQLRRRRLYVPEVAWLGVQLASALRYLHAQGVLHLDVKPGNVIIGGGRARLFDLSLAQPSGPVDAGLGTADFLSPEQGLGGEVTAASDAWGLGLTLYIAVTGLNPFADEDQRPRRDPGSRPKPSHDHHTSSGTCIGYRQNLEQAPPAGTLRRLPRELSGLLDACLDPIAGSRPTLADLDIALHRIAGSDRPPWPEVKTRSAMASARTTAPA